MLMRCTICGASNQLAASRLGEALKCSRCRQVVPPPAHAISATEADVAEILNDAPWPVLLEFWSPQSEAARAATSELERFARRQQGRLIVLRVNTAQGGAGLQRFTVGTLPTYVLFDHGRELRRLTGAQSAEQLEFAFRAA